MSIDKDKLISSLGTISEVFPDMSDACVKGYSKVVTDRLEDMEEIQRCIRMFLILKGIPKLTPRKLELLAYYLKMGYSRESKDKITRRMKMKDSNLNNLNSKIRDLGLIKQVGHNQSNNEINPELVQFKKDIVDNKGSYILIKIEDA